MEQAPLLPMVIAPGWDHGCIGNHGGGRVKAITSCCYHNSVVYYSRLVANFCRRSILFSSGDYPRTLSSILSGEGLDEREQG
jgi:hypothetical protein